MRAKKPSKSLPNPDLSARLPNFQRSAEQFGPVRYALNVRSELIEALGGEASLTPQQVIVTDHIAFIDSLLRRAEHDFLVRGTLPTTDFTQLMHALTSLLKHVGMKRRESVVPSALEYAARAAQSQGPVEP